MKSSALALLGLIVGYLEFSDDLAVWLPAFGALGDGQVIGQTVILGVLALIAFGSAVFLSYRALTWIFE